jgi:hypothetical protein
VVKARVDNKCYEIVPRFVGKCPVCGYESQKEEATCPVTSGGVPCPGVMRVPDINQKRRAEVFFDQPNETSETEDIIKSILRYSLAVDDWYLSISQHPLTIYVEDSRYMRVVADKLGRLGNGEYFCPTCLSDAQGLEDPLMVQSACEKVYPLGDSCPDHPGEDLVETCYIYQDGTSVKARFGRDEIIHKFQDAWLPDLYGHSKVVAVLRQVRSVTAMDKWNFDTYTTGKLGQIIAFKDMDQDEVNAIADDIEEGIKHFEDDADTGAVARKLRTLYLSTKAGIDVVDVMPPIRRWSTSR